MGLLDFCERDLDACAEPRDNRVAVARSIAEARRLAWTEVLSRTGSETHPGSTGRVRVHAEQNPAPGPSDGGFLGGLDIAGLYASPGEHARVEAINAAINSSVVAISDRRRYGRPDVWALPSALPDGRLGGDCEDYVLAKRDALLRAGFASERLSIALARTPEGEDHAVLLITFPDGDYVLDNRDNRVLPWARTALVWQSRQRPGELLRWIRL